MASRATDWDNVPGFDRVKQEYVRLDLNRWLKDNDILDHARKQGKQNKPAADQTDMDGIPAKIVAWVNRRGRICRQNVSGYLDDLERNLADMENQEELRVREQEIRGLLGDAEIDLEGKVSDGRNLLAGPEQELQAESADFRAFRRENKLRRQPDYKHRRTALRYVLAFFVIELVLNATMLMEVNAFGLLGSMVQMGLIGLANVGVLAWCMGGVLRQASHVSIARKLIFSVLAVVLVFAVILANAVVGHFRDSMQAVLGDASADIFAVGSDTFDRFSAGMFAFDSFQSALLAFLGVLFFGVATWKWLDRDDRYPDYGRRHRRLLEKQQEYVAKFDDARRQLQSAFDQHESKLHDIRHELVARRTRWREQRGHGRRIVDDFSTNLEQYQHDMNALLSEYYTANRSTRTEPAPEWFSDRAKVDAEILVAPTFNPPERTSFATVTDKVDDAIGALQENFRTCRRQFRGLDGVMAASDEEVEVGR